MQQTHFDVAIAGGGPAGAAAGLSLAQAGLRVLIADSSSTHAFRPGESLPPSARPLLHRLGVLERVMAAGHRPSAGSLACWGGPQPTAEDFIRQLHGHGLQLDRARFDADLREAACRAGAQVLESTTLRLQRAGSPGRPHQLRLQDASDRAQTIEADWVIDASGRAASLARALGARRVRHDALIAFYLRLQGGSEHDQDGRTLVEAVEEGWWYSSLLPSDQRLLVFLGDSDRLPHRRLLSAGGLWNAHRSAPMLSQLFDQHGWRPIEPSGGADASSSELDHAAGERWFAAGDAALGFDPIASKGISNALYTGLQAARALLDTCAGETAASARYCQHLNDIHVAYRQQLSACYALENRWSHAPFWARRLQPRALPSPLEAKTHEHNTAVAAS
jgi:flavin-dependent dehydrogenase